MATRGPRRTSPIKKRVGARVRALRERQALSLAELGRRAGTSTSEIALIEQGERAPTVVSLEAIAKGLGVRVAAFFEDEPNPSPPAPSVRVWYRLTDRLRDRSAEELRVIERLLDAFDRAVDIRTGR